MNSVITLFTTSAAGKKSTSTLGSIWQTRLASTDPRRLTQSNRIDILSMACIMSSALFCISSVVELADVSWTKKTDSLICIPDCQILMILQNVTFAVYMQVKNSFRAGTTCTGLDSVKRSVASFTRRKIILINVWQQTFFRGGSYSFWFQSFLEFHRILCLSCMKMLL